jgi:glucosamine--fructose-6-phosphate aminotransferase (isomerizing)
MCGIVGYVGNHRAAEILLNGLKRLEYRGYDSAGIAAIHDGRLDVTKASGKVQNLADSVYSEWSEERQMHSRLGIAHTRWATHGPPTQANAHPHLDQSGRIAMVHNGIIENYAEIRRRLTAAGHEFKSDTDSEALVHLIGEYYQDDLLHAVCAALRQVEGTFGIAVICLDAPDRLIVARRGSPIVIGLGTDETIVASDASAIVAHTDQVIFLDDDDVATVTAEGVDIRNIQNVPVSREISKIDWDAKAAEKSGYEHFMLKEIFEQPDALRNTIRGRLDVSGGTAVLSGLSLTPREMVEISRVVLMGCGTSLHAAMTGEYYFEDLADLPADVEQAAEFRYRNPIIHARDLAIAISQSGETADTLAAVREAKQKGALVAGICNVVGSTIARETGLGVYLHAGPEIGVASTKAFTSQLTVMLMMALKFGRCRRLARQVGMDLCQEIESIPDMVEQVLAQNERISQIAEKYAKAEDFFFIGRGYLYPAALEGALKLKEISYIHAEGYHAAELKHGPIALLQEDVPVMALVCDIPGKEKTIGNVEECRARHAPVLAIVTEGDDCVDAYTEDIITVPRTSQFIAPITSVVAMQLFSYHVARHRGCEIDQPRNLAKSVTVE